MKNRFADFDCKTVFQFWQLPNSVYPNFHIEEKKFI